MPANLRATRARTAILGQRRSRLTHVIGASVIAMSAAAGMAGLSGTAASAATSAHNKAHSTTVTLKSLESKLTGLESGYVSGTTLTEAGSSLVYPLMVEWEGHGPAAGLSPAAGGSGKGQSGAEGGTIDIGGSDPYLPESTLSQFGVVNIPLVVSAQDAFYNIPGLKASTHLNLNGTILSQIYAGQITKWDDPAIKKINKGVNIPDLTIVPVHRSDSSGDTFLFTSYLFDQDPNGLASSGPTQLESWPNVSGELAASGNAGMQSTCESTPGCVAYIGVSYIRGSLANGLGYAALQNGWTKKGAPHFIIPNTNSINNEVASFKQIPATAGISLINSASAPQGYPIVNFEYAIVKTGSSKAAAIKAFLAWAMDPNGGSASSYLAPVDFRPLPVNALQVAINLINQV